MSTKYITIEPNQAGHWDTKTQRVHVRVTRETETDWYGFPVYKDGSRIRAISDPLVFPKIAWQEASQ